MPPVTFALKEIWATASDYPKKIGIACLDGRHKNKAVVIFKMEIKQKPKICKYCKKQKHNKGYSEFCSINCYQLYKYHNDAEYREKHKERIKVRHKERWKTDKEFRKKQMGYSRDWQLRHIDRTREISRLSARRQYAKKKENEK